MRRLGCALLVVLVAAVLLPAAPAAAEGAFAPPVPTGTPLLDRFRLPEGPYGPGNRGIDYGTEPGTAVTASAAGEVVFAGTVAGTHHVVVLHPGGLRTSYSFLSSVAVRRGDRVERGDPVGVAGPAVHFGVRAGEQYLDPEAMLAGVPPSVRLVPLEDLSKGSVWEELGGLVRSLGGTVVRAGAAGVDWARREVAAGIGVLRAEWDAFVLTARLFESYRRLDLRVLELWRRGRAYLDDQAGCTPAGVAPRARPPGRRIAVLVGGLGSGSGAAAVLDVDTRALGYGDEDVAQFSYRGGQSPGPRRLEGIDTSTYGPADSSGDIRAASARLRDLLVSIRLRHPGVPVDLIAHSQGGIVVRGALGLPADAHDARLPPIEHVLTLGTPHHGADLATANAALGGTTPGQLVQAGLDQVGVEATSEATAQLAEVSDLLEELDRRPPPAGARFTSIAARGDLVAPALSSALDGAVNVVVPVDGASAHDRLPGSAPAARELALALAGMGPTCRDVRGDVLRAGAIGLAEDAVGGALVAVDVATGNRW